MVYDAFGRLAAEYGGTADPVGTEYLTADHLGSTRLVTSSTGAERRCLDYLPFGEQMTQGMGTRGACYASATEPRVKFTGKERDAETGLDYFLARYYSAAQGRFTSPDEFQGGIVDPFTGQQVGAPGPLPYADITDPQTLNKYAYVRNNPLRYTDPDGHVIDYLLDAAGIAFDLNEIRKNPSIGNFVQLGADVVLAAVPFVPTIGAVKAGAKAVELGADVARAGEKGMLAVQRGRQAEKSVLEAEGLVKNTKAIQAVDPKTGKVATTIPDAIRASGQTVEVKDVKRLSDSPQLRRQPEISRAAGQRGQVITGTNTKVSETVQRRMEVRRRKDLGPDEP
jgi:RHS repeat-associated protein